MFAGEATAAAAVVVGGGAVGLAVAELLVELLLLLPTLGLLPGFLSMESSSADDIFAFPPLLAEAAAAAKFPAKRGKTKQND